MKGLTHIGLIGGVRPYIYTKVLVRRGVLGPSPCSFRASPFPPVRHRQGAQNGSKRLSKKAQRGSKRRSKRLFEPARCRQCARRGCSSLLRCRLCAQRGFSSVLFEIAVRKSWSRLHCALSHCTLHCFAPCMDMHGSTLVGLCITKYRAPLS